jgi:hypothetical protein
MWKGMAVAGAAFAVGFLVLAGSTAGAAPLAPASQAGSGLDPAYLDQLLGPVALYPDQLLAQILLCAGNSSKVTEFSGWLKVNAQRKGSELQQAAQDAGFEPSFIALAPFPQVVEMMAKDLRWTSALGGAFLVDRDAVFDSIQRLRGKSQAAGNLKTTPQQKVEQRTTQSGEQVIVIEPANPQVVYVPQYNPQVVYTQPAPTTTTTTVIVKEDDDDDEAAAAGALVGFAAGIAIGAAFDNNYYYGPYGWHGGGAYMYSGGWDDWYDDREDAREDFYDNREDAREDWQDNREDMAGERSDRAENAREQRTERTEQRTEQRGERSGTAQEQRTERQQNRGSAESQAQRDQRRTDAKSSAQEARASGQASTRSSGERSQARAERSGTRSDAFSGYSSGSSTRSASSRGSRSRSGGGGGRSGGRRR